MSSRGRAPAAQVPDAGEVPPAAQLPAASEHSPAVQVPDAGEHPPAAAGPGRPPGAAATPGLPSHGAAGLGRPTGDASTAYLFARLALLERRVRDAVARRRAVDADPNDRFRGLYISDEQVDALLAGPADPLVPAPASAEAAALLDLLDASVVERERAGERIRLRDLATSFGLDQVDLELLVVALAPDLDPRFERLFGYLHDDVSRRRASVGLALELAGGLGSGSLRARLGPLAPLLAGHLLLVEDAERPTLTRSLRVPDRVTRHLLGDDSPDPVVEALLTGTVDLDMPEVDAVCRGLDAGQPLAYLRERAGASGRSVAATALARLGREAVALDLARLAPSDDPLAIAAAASREARLRRGGLVVGPVEALAERGAPAVRAFAELPGPVLLVGSRDWDPAWSREPPLGLEVAVPPVGRRHDVWAESLGADAPEGFDPALATIAFRLAPEQIGRAARAARAIAVATGRPMTVEDVSAGARAQNAAGLERLARRIVPSVGWDDLVLPSVAEQQLRELTARARHRDRVVGSWRMGTKGARGLGITALFAGESGTGKTMAAEVLAGDLGFDLYLIDLSTVVDKYIGETEKNLDRIFTEADRVNGILLFDEADALFGKRSEVKDARDRYANVEVAYLLQRMERFDGLAILTTNLRSNVDEAFVRRLDAIIDFPMPEEEDRRRLWGANLTTELPTTDDIDLDFLAHRFKISGGNIRNICVTAAYLAAAGDRAVGMGDLIRATEREYRKLGRLTVQAEFGEWYTVAAG